MFQSPPTSCNPFLGDLPLLELSKIPFNFAGEPIHLKHTKIRWDHDFQCMEEITDPNHQSDFDSLKTHRYTMTRVQETWFRAIANHEVALEWGPVQALRTKNYLDLGVS